MRFRLRIGERQRFHSVFVFAGEVQRDPAGDENSEIGSRVEDRTDRGSVVRELLHVVEDEQHVQIPEVLRQRIDGMNPGSLPESQGPRDRPRDERGLRDGAEIHEADVAAANDCGPEGESRLTGASRAGDRDESMSVQQG